jgi:hypothetical protein
VVDFLSRCSLSAGRAVSLLGVTLHESRIRSNQPELVFVLKINNLLENTIKKRVKAQ